jgi:adenylylsulfate kinase-like enzyme
MPILVPITGPIAAGKNTVATVLADRFIDAGRSVIIADVDEVAMMVCAPGGWRGGTLVRCSPGPRCACRAVAALRC